MSPNGVSLLTLRLESRGEVGETAKWEVVNTRAITSERSMYLEAWRKQAQQPRRVDRQDLPESGRAAERRGLEESLIAMAETREDAQIQ